jgi:thiamine-monophosphate kinase
MAAGNTSRCDGVVTFDAYTVRSVKEFSLIEQFVSRFDAPPSPAGPGDDCAVIGRTVVTTDALVENVHFTRAFSFEDIGHKALAVNLSDVAAMGATPSWFTVALALPADVTSQNVTSLARGMSKLAREHHAKLVGGNVTRAGELSITITAAGTLKRAPLLRSGARVGDSIYVSGPLGDAAGGLRFDALVRAQRRPSPHVAFGQLASRFASACIDVSDGLAQDLGHVCEASMVGAELQRDALPISRALRRAAGDEAEQLALIGGEDYVLLITVPERRRAAFERAAKSSQLAAHRIGTMTHGNGVSLDGKPLRGRLGFQHR